MRAGFVVSDLHLLAERSMAWDVAEHLAEAAAAADVFVFNGDVFDFQWSTLPSAEHSLESAESYVRNFAKACPGCRVCYVMGNHDGIRPFATRLDAVARELPNFEWHPSHVRIGGNLFLHGDLVLNGRSRDPLHRPLQAARRQKGLLANLGYRMVVATRVLRHLELYHTPKRCARRLLRSVAAGRLGPREGLSDIFFGHTHVPFSDFTYGGVTFHNTGSCIRKLAFNPVRFRI